MDDVKFCEKLMEKEKLLIIPGSLCFGHGKDLKGYVKIGYCATVRVERGDGCIGGHF